MLNHILSTIRRTVALFLILVAFLFATVMPAIMGQPETNAYIFEGSNPWYAASIRQTNAVAVGNNPLYQGQAIAAGAVIMANHDFEG